MTAHERTGWRDQSISERHRQWGANCPSCDLDFLLLEYNVGLPTALVEYKHHLAQPVDLRHATYRALTALADRGDPIPFLLAYYWPETWSFYVYPVNAAARAIYPERARCLSERRFVSSLYVMRRRTIETAVLARLHDTPPPDGALMPCVVSTAEAAP